MMTEAEPAAPEPVQVMAYVLLPAVEMVTASDPEVDVWAVQLAEQAVALVEDQVKLEVLLTNTDEASAVRETVAAGGVEPPPPQEVIKNIDAASKRLFFIVIIYTHFENTHTLKTFEAPLVHVFDEELFKLFEVHCKLTFFTYFVAYLF